jgi:FkbH-like protein
LIQKPILTDILGKKLKIIFLSNYSIEFLFDLFKKKLNDIATNTEIFYPGFNQYQQEIFNPQSRLFQINPEIVFLSVDINFYLSSNIEIKNNPPISEQAKNQIDQLFEAINTASEKLPTSTIFVDNFYLDSTLSFGTLEYNFFGLEKFVSELNNQLYDLSSKYRNIRIVNLNGMINKFGQKNLFDYRFYYLAKSKWNKKGLEELSNLYLSHIKAYLGIRKKCIAVDLDNTLWGGIIGQDGIENIQLSNDGAGKAFYDFQLALLNYYKQGIILSICSKNSENVVNEVFEKHPYMVLKPEHFAVKKINWNNKVENLIEIAKELNIGLDSIVFLDDSKFERELVKQQLPQVEVPELPEDPSQYASFLKELDFFNFHKLTDDDFKRNETYRLNSERKKAESEFANIQDYLRSLQMKIEIKEIDDFTFPRVVQLIQKTNQFNTTTKRYTENDVSKMRSSDEWKIYSFSVSDKFGDNGIVGVFILKIIRENSELNIDSFIMSCRVIGREIENAILYFIVNKAKELNLEKITADIFPTAKNEPCRDVYKIFGFEKVNETGWVLNLNDREFELPDYFQLSSL